MYFPIIETPGGRLVSMKMVPMQIRNFRLNRVSDHDAGWLLNILNREGSRLGTSVSWDREGYYSLSWD